MRGGQPAIKDALVLAGAKRRHIRRAEDFFLVRLLGHQIHEEGGATLRATLRASEAGTEVIDQRAFAGAGGPMIAACCRASTVSMIAWISSSRSRGQG